MKSTCNITIKTGPAITHGFERSIADMYFIPIGLFVKSGALSVLWKTVGKTASDFSSITWTNFIFANLLPVTIGNIFGGAVMVGLVYWFIYLLKGLSQNPIDCSWWMKKDWKRVPGIKIISFSLHGTFEKQIFRTQLKTVPNLKQQQCASRMRIEWHRCQTDFEWE